MEDLQEALEDAQYFNAIHKNGPKGSARIKAPSMLDLKDWLQNNEDEALLNNIPSIAADNLGFYLFLKYCAINGDLPSALFIESVAKFKALSSGRARQVALADIKRLFTAAHSDPPSEPVSKPSLATDESESTVASKVPTSFEFIDEMLVRKVSPTAAALGARAYDNLGKRYCSGTWPPNHPCSIIPAQVSPPLDAGQTITFSATAAADAAAQLMADAKTSSSSSSSSSPAVAGGAVDPVTDLAAPAVPPPDASAPGVSDASEAAARVASEVKPQAGGGRNNAHAPEPAAAAAPLQLPFRCPHSLMRMTLTQRGSDHQAGSLDTLRGGQQNRSRPWNDDMHITTTTTTTTTSSPTSRQSSTGGFDGDDASASQEEKARAQAPRETLDLVEALVFEYLARKHGPLFLVTPPGFFDNPFRGNTTRGVTTTAATVVEVATEMGATEVGATGSSRELRGSLPPLSSGPVAPLHSADSPLISQPSPPQSPSGGNTHPRRPSVISTSVKVHPLAESCQETKVSASTQGSNSSAGSSKKGGGGKALLAADSSSFSIVRFSPSNDSNAYYKWLEIQYVKAQPVGEEDFTQFRVLGRGGFGLVYGCMRKATGHLYAMKTLDRRRVKMKRANDLCWNERVILGRLNSPFIVCLKYAFVSKQDLFLIMDLMLGGDLSFWLSKKRRFNRQETCYHAGRIYLALRHIHKHHIVYRDLKPENILMDETGRTKLSDLGLACLVTPNMRGACGTRGYIAPEMLCRDGRGHPLVYNETVDWFSFGCVLFELRIGCSPFRTSHARKWMTAREEAQQQQQQQQAANTAAAAAAAAKLSTTQQGSGNNKSASTNVDGTSSQKFPFQKFTTGETDSSPYPTVVGGAALAGGSVATASNTPPGTPGGWAGSCGSAGGGQRSAVEASAGRSGGSLRRALPEAVAQPVPAVKSRKDRIDLAVMEMEVMFPPLESNSGKELGGDFMAICKALLTKSPVDRLGFHGAEGISNHPWFRNEVDLGGVQQDTVEPPIIPGKDIHAHSQASIGFFSEDLSHIDITEEDDNALCSWNFSSTSAFNKEVIGVFKETDAPSLGLGAHSGGSSRPRGGLNREEGHATVEGGSCCAVS